MIGCVIEVVTVAWAEEPVLTAIEIVAALVVAAGAVALCARPPLTGWRRLAWRLALIPALAIVLALLWSALDHIEDHDYGGRRNPVGGLPVLATVVVVAALAVRESRRVAAAKAEHRNIRRARRLAAERVTRENARRRPK